MKTIKTCELTGAALDWAVAQTLGEGTWWKSQEFLDSFHPSTDWSDGGPIIEREGINMRLHSGTDKQPIAFVWVSHQPAHRQHGPTPLIAAMRCYVASKLGDEVEVPDELAL